MTKTSMLRNIISATKGQFFSVRFVKENGSMRNMICRTGVKKGIKGTGYPMSESKKLIRWRVYDMNKKAYRTIPIDRIRSIKTVGLTIK